MEEFDKRYELRKYILSTLAEMQDAKETTNVLPSWITKDDLFKAIDKDVRDILNQLFKNKVIKVHKTIHPSTKDYVELLKKEN